MTTEGHVYLPLVSQQAQHFSALMNSNSSDISWLFSGFIYTHPPPLSEKGTTDFMCFFSSALVLIHHCAQIEQSILSILSKVSNIHESSVCFWAN